MSDTDLIRDTLIHIEALQALLAAMRVGRRTPEKALDTLDRTASVPRRLQEALVATPAPLMDIQKQSVVTPAPLGGLRAWLEVQPQYDTEMSNSTRARQKWQREHDAWLQHGPSVVRAALAATPAPLDGYVTVKTADLQAVRDMLEKAQALNAALLPAVVAAAAAEHAGPSPANGPKREYIGYAEPKEADRE